ncbi:MAG: hypothetical protein RLZZ396_2991 [Planctomycetota bacterium]
MIARASCLQPQSVQDPSDLFSDGVFSVAADRRRGRLAEIEFFEREIGINLSYAPQLDIATGGLDVIDRQRQLGRIDDHQLLMAVTQRGRCHQMSGGG